MMSWHVGAEALLVCTTRTSRLLEAKPCKHQVPQSQDAHLHDDVESLAAAGRPSLACCVDNGAGRLSPCWAAVTLDRRCFWI